MKPSILYRAASVLLVLFAASHLFGFSQVDPAWGVDSLVASMKSTRFDMVGSKRSYWDLFLALGYTVGISYVFCAALAWQLAGLPAETLKRLRLTTWAFALSFVGITVISVCCLFIIPIAMSGVIALCLIGAAWLSSR